MNLKRHTTFILSMILLVLLAACGGTAVSPTPPPAEEPAAPEAAPSESTGPATGNHIYNVDTEASQASYIVDEEFFAEALTKLGIEAGTTVVIGTTPGVSGKLVVNFDADEIIEQAEFTVDMTGLKTDQDRRDNWLTENAITTGVFPQATFVATSTSGLPDTINMGESINFQLTGDLTVRDVTNEVTFDVTAVLSENSIRGIARLPLKMTDFGITPPDFANTLTVADDFVIEVELTAVEELTIQ